MVNEKLEQQVVCSKWLQARVGISDDRYHKLWEETFDQQASLRQQKAESAR